MNSVILIGRIVKKPELEYKGETAITKFTIAVDRPTKAGEEKKAEFIRITAFGKRAESICRYMDKGRQIAVQGRLQTGSYTKDGKTVYTTDVICDNDEFLGGAPEPKQEQKPKYEAFSPYDDGMPF